MKSLSILGCGFLGYALAKEVKRIYSLKVSTTKIEKLNILKEEGFSSFLINDDNLAITFFNCDILLINIPPSKSKDYLKLLKNIYQNIKSSTKVIFISSTSIYAKEEKEFFETESFSFDKESLVFKAESLIKHRSDVIFRSAGLMGYSRIAGKYFAGKNLLCGNELVNYVHRDDLINAIIFVIEKEIKGIFNICAPLHPSKEEVYLFNAKKYAFLEAKFTEKQNSSKRIINQDLLVSKGFKYIYSNPLDFI